MDYPNSSSAAAGNGLPGNGERDGHIQLAQPFSGDELNGAVSGPAGEDKVSASMKASEGGLESSYFESQPLQDVATIDVLLQKMESKVMHSYSLGQIGPFVTNPGSSNGEVTVEMNTAAPQGDPEPKDFRQAAEHILRELKKMNEMFTPVIVDPQAIKKVLEQLEQKAAYICVAGRYNTGKSTLINALLGSKILPSSRDAETAVTVYITVQATCTNDCTENGHPHLYPWPGSSTEKPICSGADAINKHLQKENLHLRRQSAAQEKDFVVRTPIPMFSKFPELGEGLTPYLVDLPGSNEVCQRKLSNVAKLSVETATGFLYIMTYNELRNEQDMDAIKAIYNRDKQVFDDGRLIIVVTQYDISCDSSNQNKLTVEDVQETVAGMIFKALNLLKPLSREIIVPVSGLWAFLARMYQSSEGSVHRKDVTKSLVRLLVSRNATPEEMNEVFSLNREKAYSTLEEASRIVELEQQMKEVTRSMISVWKRGIAKNCDRFICTARETLDEKYQSVNKESTEVKKMLETATNLYELHQKVISTIQKGSVVLNELRESYDEDVKPGNKLNILIASLVSTFMAQVRSKKEETKSLLDKLPRGTKDKDFEFTGQAKHSHGRLGLHFHGASVVKEGRNKSLPDKLQRDVQNDFRVHAEKEMQTFIQWVKYNRCDKELQRAINKTAEHCGRLRKASTLFIQNDQGSLPNMTEEHCLEESHDDALGKNDDTLEELYGPPMDMMFGNGIKLVISVDEHLNDLGAHIKRDLQLYYEEHFKQIKEEVILYFFKIYCQKTEHSLDSFYKGMADVDVVSLISQYKEKNASLQQELDNLEHWRSQTLPDLDASLKLLGV